MHYGIYSIPKAHTHSDRTVLSVSITRPGFGPVIARSLGLERQRESDREGAAQSLGALDADASAMLLDDGVADR